MCRDICVYERRSLGTNRKERWCSVAHLSYTRRSISVRGNKGATELFSPLAWCEDPPCLLVSAEHCWGLGGGFFHRDTCDVSEEHCVFSSPDDPLVFWVDNAAFLFTAEGSCAPTLKLPSGVAVDESVSLSWAARVLAALPKVGFEAGASICCSLVGGRPPPGGRGALRLCSRLVDTPRGAVDLFRTLFCRQLRSSIGVHHRVFQKAPTPASPRAPSAAQALWMLPLSPVGRRPR